MLKEANKAKQTIHSKTSDSKDQGKAGGSGAEGGYGGAHPAPPDSQVSYIHKAGH